MSILKSKQDELDNVLLPFLNKELKKDKRILRDTINKNTEIVADLWFALSRFDRIPRLIIDKQDALDRQSVSQVVLFPEALNNLKLAFINGLEAHYAVGNSLLRHYMESVIIGAICEYLSHDRYRKAAKFLPKELLNKVNSLSNKRKTSIENRSSLILLEIWKVFEKKYNGLNIFDMLQCLKKWRKLSPYTDKQIYNLYGCLSKFTHQSPARSDIFQSAMHSVETQPFYEIGYNQPGFNEFSKNMFAVIDVGMVISIGTLMSFVDNNWQTKAVFNDQLKLITQNKISLPKTIKKLEQLKR